jgi:hypothetical protein
MKNYLVQTCLFILFLSVLDAVELYVMGVATRVPSMLNELPVEVEMSAVVSPVVVFLSSRFSRRAIGWVTSVAILLALLNTATGLAMYALRSSTTPFMLILNSMWQSILSWLVLAWLAAICTYYSDMWLRARTERSTFWA